MDSIESLESYKVHNLELSLLEMEIKGRITHYQENEKRAVLLSMYILDIFLNTKDLGFLDAHGSADFIKERLQDLKTIFEDTSIKNKTIDLLYSFLNTQSKSIITTFKETDKVLDDLFNLKNFKKIPKSIGRNSGGYLNKDDILFLDDMFGDGE